LCDNTAVRWSEYELARTQQESEICSKISKQLQKYVEEYKENGFSKEYIMGMERAVLLVLYDARTQIPTTNSDVQDKLF
jgi:hypothetical protein